MYLSFEPDKIKSYVYLVIDIETRNVYVGSRGGNVRLKLTPNEDLGVQYFTSSNYFKRMFLSKKPIENFEWRVLFTTESYNDAFEIEEQMYWELLNQGAILINRMPPTHGQAGWWRFCSPEQKKEIEERRINSFNSRTEEQRLITKLKTQKTNADKDPLSVAKTHEKRSKSAIERQKNLLENCPEYYDTLINSIAKARENIVYHSPKEWMSPEEWKDFVKIRNSKFDRNEATKKRVRNNKGKNNGNYFSEESLNLIANKKKGVSNPMWKGYLVTPHGVFSTIKKACELLNCGGSSIKTRIEALPDSFFFSKKDFLNLDVVTRPWIKFPSTRNKRSPEKMKELYKKEGVIV